MPEYDQRAKRGAPVRMRTRAAVGLAMSSPRHVAGVPVVMGMLSAIAVAAVSSQERLVLAPALAAAFIVVCTGVLLWAREGNVPMFDVGMVCALATLVYMIVPLFGYMFDGLQFTANDDPRLFRYQPTPSQLGSFHWNHVLYLLSLCATYFFVRRRAPRISVGVVEPSRETILVVAVMFGLLYAYFGALQLFLGFDYQASYADLTEAYGRGEEVKLPRILAQISHYLFGWYTLFKLALLILVVRRARSKRWFVVLCTWMTLEVLLAFLNLGARTGTVMLVMGAIIMYHRTVRPIRFRNAAILAGVLLWGFLAFGVQRGHRGYRGENGVVTSANEFQSLLGTAWDVKEKTKAGTLNPPWQAYFNDVMAALPMQQIMPFEKIAAAHWYADQMNSGVRGVAATGFMWGVMSQVAIGYGWLELVLRGCLLGLLLGWLHLRFCRDPTGFVPTLLYLWLCLHIYNTFRDSTFSLLANAIWEVLPVLFILRFFPALIPRAR